MTWPETVYQSVRARVDQFRHLFRPDRMQNTRTLALRYQITLHNDSPLSQDVILVIPEPACTSTQELKTALQYSQEPDGRDVDSQEGNTFVYWKKTLCSGERIQLAQSYEIELRPNDTRSLLGKEGNTQERALLSQKRLHHDLLSPGHLSPEHPEIQKIAYELQATVGRECSLPLIHAINDRVCELLTYASPIPGLYSAREAIETKKVDCGGFDTLFVSLCLACGIPARVVCGFWTEAEQAMHAWAEAMLPDGTWIPVDPSIEWLRARGRTKRPGEVGYTGSDRVIYSYGCDLPLTIDEETTVVAILQTPLTLPVTSPVKATYKFLSRSL